MTFVVTWGGYAAGAALAFYAIKFSLHVGLTHGPAAHGAHTTQERVSVDELLRVARVYALTALGFCPG